MNSINNLIISALLILAFPLFGKEPFLTKKQITSPPGRIIRPCCSFGSYVPVMIIPGLKITDITNRENIGKHRYLGNSEEGNGIIYTQKGGFIDLGHLRDMADWTAYLYIHIQKSREDGGQQLQLRREGGSKKLDLWIPTDLEPKDAMRLAGKIAYDLSVWHEIATWFGASLIPLIPERYSSFSVEDAYSNLLGVTLGMEALESDLPFEEAMTKLIDRTLEELGVVDTEAETYAAMELVLEVWWTRTKRLPNLEILLQRQLKVYPSVEPWLVPGWAGDSSGLKKLDVPLFTQAGQLLTDLYELRLKLNNKFPFRRMFPYRNRRIITEDDFEVLLDRVELELKALGMSFQRETP